MNQKLQTDEYYRYAFTELLAYIESQFPQCTSAGDGSEPNAECVRLSTRWGLEFAGGDVNHCEYNADSNKVEIDLNFFRLGGADGPLPMPYSEYLIKRRQRKDRAAVDFLDQFTHRQIAILYRALKHLEPAKHGPSVEQEPFSQLIYALIGFGLPQLQNRLTIQDRTLIGYAAGFINQRRSRAGLERLIAHFFDLETRIETQIGQ